MKYFEIDLEMLPQDRKLRAEYGILQGKLSRAENLGELFHDKAFFFSPELLEEARLQLSRLKDAKALEQRYSWLKEHLESGAVTEYGQRLVALYLLLLLRELPPTIASQVASPKLFERLCQYFEPLFERVAVLFWAYLEMLYKKYVITYQQNEVKRDNTLERERLQQQLALLKIEQNEFKQLASLLQITKDVNLLTELIRIGRF
jgi:hypothetical protein